ncbi:hypothetical protein CIHG_06963 [Coccidioides immitis H538.4]|uniref:Uncharacterized protein n=1 Tax=Coccidioides immitis H538.4 TaxID=396776 RepID=A0A0J8RXJ1_COCIT|nr:hypothetical protein CIHG_06963 [Coccidioides immitis H538.4]
MSLSIPPLSPSSKRRRPLHERTPSQSNERPPASTLRLVMDKSSEDEADIYSTDPYPTKPEHILLPTPSDNQYGGPLTSNPVSASFHNDSTDTSPSSAEYASRNFPEDHGGSVSELSTLVQEGNLSSFIWGESQNSSNTSIPHLATPVIDEAVEAGDEKSESSDRTRLPPLNTTIKTVPQDDSTPEQSDSGLTSSSSPIVVRLGLTSSPNIIPLESSSPNFMPLVTSSPYYVKESASDSSLYSANTFGTARRGIDTYTDGFCIHSERQSPSISKRSLIAACLFRLMSRPGSSASSILNTIPTWAKVYYRSGGAGLQLSALSLVEGSRPSTAASARPAAHLGPLEISRTRSRPRKNTDTRLALPTADTRDPRTHWAGGFQHSERNVPKTPFQEDFLRIGHHIYFQIIAQARSEVSLEPTFFGRERGGYNRLAQRPNLFILLRLLGAINVVRGCVLTTSSQSLSVKRGIHHRPAGRRANVQQPSQTHRPNSLRECPMVAKAQSLYDTSRPYNHCYNCYPICFGN